MLIFKGFPREQIDSLRPGDFFVDGPVCSLRRTNANTTGRKYLIITTVSGARFTAHFKYGGYNVFRKRARE
jgi:hypothetical protein